MKLTGIFKLFLVIGLFHTSCAQAQPISEKEFFKIKEIYQSGDYFELRDALSEIKNLDRAELFYYNAVAQTAFNNPAKSNDFIAKMESSNVQISDSLAADVLEVKINNMVRLGRYEEAYKASSKLLGEYSQAIDSTSRATAENEVKIWKSISFASPMKVSATGNTKVSFSKDKVGLDRLPVSMGEKETSFVFDSGANFSVLQRSVAIELGMEVIDVNFDVRGFTGQFVKSDIAIADKLTIGNHTITNVVFLVFDDDILTFPQADYEIEGIVGFPVIDQVGEVRINQKAERLEIPEQVPSHEINNMAMDGFMPLLQIHAHGEALLCYFDTGAVTTSMYSTYYNKYKSAIHEKGYKRTEFNPGGAGGSKKIAGYIVPEFDIRVGNTQTVLTNVSVFAESLTANETRFANIGQDLINQFDVLIINFKSMSLFFE